jgi:hypothetical protein
MSTARQSTRATARGRALRVRPFFSLGGVLAGCLPHTTPYVPWLITATGLALLGCWDAIRAGGSLDFVVLGLAAYELLIGLTEEQRQQKATVDRQ